MARFCVAGNAALSFDCPLPLLPLPEVFARSSLASEDKSGFGKLINSYHQGKYEKDHFERLYIPVLHFKDRRHLM
jgi:hypothetical protein